MIDFRYHVVSLAAVFLALAVGIVLGAGPLQGEIGNTLEAQVSQLRTDKTALNEEVSRTNAALTANGGFIAETLDESVGGTLTGATVGLLVMPGASNGTLTSVEQAVQASGATQVWTGELKDAWVDPDSADRDEAIAAVTGTGADAAPSSSEPNAVLAELLTLRTPKAAGTKDAAAAKKGVEKLTAAGLIDLDLASFEPVSNLIIVGRDGHVEGDEAAARTEALTRLVDAVARRAYGSVTVAGAGNDNDSADLLAAIRANNDIARTATTVDTVQLPMGAASVPLALLADQQRQYEQYGLAGDATKAYPPAAAP